MSARVLTLALPFLLSCFALAQEPSPIPIDIQSDNMRGFEVEVRYKDASEVEDAVPGGTVNLTVTLRALQPLALKLTHIGSPLGEREVVFNQDFIKLRKDNVRANGFYIRTYEVATAVERTAQPRERSLQFDFLGPTGTNHACAVLIPVGTVPPERGKGSSFVKLIPPAQITLNAFQKENAIEFNVENAFPSYDIEILGYRIENPQDVFVTKSFRCDPGVNLLKVRHGKVDTLSIALPPDNWKALVTPASSPTMTVSLIYADPEKRLQTVTYTALPFEVHYGPSITIVCCIAGALLGALFRLVRPENSGQRAGERALSSAAKGLAWASRSLISVLAAVIGWLLSANYNVGFFAKGMALITAYTPTGSLFIGILMGLIPPSRYGAWLYEKLTGQKLEEPS